MMHWHVFYCQPRRELDAANEIAQLNYEAYVPLERRRVRRANGRLGIEERAYFRSYGFVRFDCQVTAWSMLVTKSVQFIICNNSIPSPISDDVIDNLQLAERLGVFDRTKDRYLVGILVQAIGGPFANFVGKIKRRRSGDRVDVLYKFFGSETVVSMPLQNLREAGP